MSKTIPKTNEALYSELLNMVAKFCDEKHPGITIVFCKEQQASTDAKELEYFCNNRCAYHKLPVEIVCLDYSILETLKASVCVEPSKKEGNN